MPPMDEAFEPIASLSEVPEGELRAFDLPGRRVTVVHVEQELFAFADECPHDLASLAEGELGATEESVVCPGDGSEFDLRTGEPVTGPAVDPLRRFPARFRDGWIEVATSAEATA